MKIPTDIAPGIRTALENRKKWLNLESTSGTAKISDRELINWHGRTAWISLFSNVQPVGENGEGTDLASKWILEGPSQKDNKFTDTFETQYTNRNSAYPHRPNPVIIGVTTTTKGRFGSLRKATISYKCFTLDQLEVLETLYMITGTSCILQWGWSTPEGLAEKLKYSDTNLIKDTFFLDTSINRLKEKRIRSQGCWDGLLGIVTDFNFSYDPVDNSYNCTTVLTAPGFEINKKELNDVSARDFKTKVNDILNSQYGEKKSQINNDNPYWVENDNVSICEYTSPTTKKKFLYASIGFIEDTLIPKLYSEIQSEESRFKSTYIEEDGQEYPVTISNISKLRSLDQTVFIIPGNPITTNHFTLGVQLGGIKAKPFSQGIPSFTRTSPGFSQGSVRNILINIKEIKKAFVEGLSADEALIILLDKLSQYTGNYWDLHLEVINNNVQIVDYNNPTNDLNKINPYIFNLYTKDSIIKEVSVTSNLPDKMKTAALYALNYSLGYTNSYNKLYPKVKDKYTTTRIAKLSEKELDELEKKQEEEQIKADEENTAFEKELNEKKDVISSKFWSRYPQYLRNLNGNSDYNRTIPIDVKLTLDGVSGIIFTNCFQVTGVPKRYMDTIYIILNIEDNIDTKGWITEFTGQMMIK